MGVLWLVFVLCHAAVALGFPDTGEWPCERGNPRLDARATLRGAITDPRIVWRRFVGSADVYVMWTPGEGDSHLEVDPTNLATDSSLFTDARWFIVGPLGEVEGRTQPLPTSGDTIYADALPDRAGLERIVFESGFAKPTINGQWQPAIARCFYWEDGHWKQAWETEPIDMLFSSQAVAGDFDADGALEIAFLPWYELVVLDARSGLIEDRCRFTTGRSYGFLGAYDLDSGGSKEFVVMADFSKHVDVLGYRNGKLALLWQREIEPDISNPQKILRVNRNPVADVDGDRNLEVLVCTYNDAGDARWRTTVHEGMTGAVKAELVDEYLRGVHDVSGDGIAELLTVPTAKAGVPKFGPIRVRGLHGGRLVTLWETADVGWATWEPPGSYNTNNCATLGRQDVIVREGHPSMTVLQQQNGDKVRLCVARWGEQGFELIGSLMGLNLTAIGLAQDGSLLARSEGASAEKREFAATGGTVQAVAAQERGGAVGTVVVARGVVSDRPVMVAQGAGENLVALVERDGEGVECWRLPGRGQSANWPNEVRGAVMGDLRGDGDRQLLYATHSPDGCARLVVTDLVLRELWHHDFSEIPGDPPVWNTGGLILWQVGHFTDRTRMDVLFTVRRSMMHSEETGVLSGVDGRELWRRNRQIENRGVGGVPFAIADFDGDGLDDAASLYPSEFYILRGVTGEDLVAKPAVWEEIGGARMYYGQAIAGCFESGDKLGIFFAPTRPAVTGLFRVDGSVVWWDAPDVSGSALPAFGDVDGDGTLEVVGVGYPNGVRCYDAATGRLEWTLAGPTPGTHGGTASGDLDSDERDEVVVSVGNTLCCFEVSEGAGEGKLAWRLELPATLGPPTIADVTGDGRASILVQGTDGYVYCIR